MARRTHDHLDGRGRGHGRERRCRTRRGRGRARAPLRRALDRSAADYQAVADGRNASFGIGDITSAVGLPDGRRFFTFGDTDYDDLTASGAAGPLTGFGNNSAWVQSGDCFTLLARAVPGVRSWLLPPQTDGSVYWPGASVVVGNRLYVFLTRLFLDRPFGRPVGAAIAAFDLPSLALAAHHDHPLLVRPRVRHRRGLRRRVSSTPTRRSDARATSASWATCTWAGSPSVRSRFPRPGASAGSVWVADPSAAKPVLKFGREQPRRAALRQRLPARDQAARDRRPDRRGALVGQPDRPVARPRRRVLDSAATTVVRARLHVSTRVHLQRDRARGNTAHRWRRAHGVQREHVRPRGSPARRPPRRPAVRRGPPAAATRGAAAPASRSRTGRRGRPPSASTGSAG